MYTQTTRTKLVLVTAFIISLSCMTLAEGEDRFTQSSRRAAHKPELIAFTGRYVNHKRRYPPGRSLLQSDEDLYQDPDAHSVSEEEEARVEQTEIIPEENRYVVAYEGEDGDVTDGDVHLYENFVHIPTDLTDNIDIIDDFLKDTGYDVIVRRRRLLDSYSVDPIGRPGRTLNGIVDGNFTNDVVETVDLVATTQFLNVPRSPSEVMSYVGVIFASLSSLSAILGICYKRNVTYVTINHPTLVDPSKPPVVESLYQPLRNSQIPKLSNNIGQTKPLLPMNELFEEMNMKTVLNVDSFLRYV
jgi:hypothetical protein